MNIVNIMYEAIASTMQELGTERMLTPREQQMLSISIVMLSLAQAERAQSKKTQYSVRIGR